MAVTILPRGPRDNFLTGTLAEYQRDPLAFVTRTARRYGDVVFLRFGPTRLVLLSHPSLVEDVLITHHERFPKQRLVVRVLEPALGNGLFTSEGDFWRRQRRMMQPAFHRERLAAYADAMVDGAQRRLATWRDGEVRDFHQEMTQITLAIVAKTLFGADVSREAPGIGRAVTELLEATNARMNNLLTVFLPYRVPVPVHLRIRRAVGQIDALIYRIIAERRASGGDPGDLLSLLLHARDEDDGSQMTDRQVRDEAMTLFGAGHETTAVALAWAGYLLARHPQVEAKLVAELDQVLRGRAPTAADFPHLRYTQMVVEETLRLYPPAWAIGRDVRQNTAVGGYPLRAGTLLMMSPCVLQRDPRYYDQPETFEPERWRDGLAHRLPRFAYFPFGGGQRQCIGQGFAILEAVLVLATVVQQFRLSLRPERRIVPAIAFTLRPKGGVPMLLQRRT
ncbi:MAG: cytochrome P450 [Dehalococcoidia bacterium]